MGEKKTHTAICILVLVVMFLASVGQAMIGTMHTSQQDGFPLFRSGSVEIWEDDFLNQSKIDPFFSENIVVNTSLGTVSMQNTYPQWIDPAFSRMKPISISNHGQETFLEYDMNLTVPYDADMRSDFSDLRFTNDTGFQLGYYALKKTNGISADLLVKIPILPQDKPRYSCFMGILQPLTKAILHLFSAGKTVQVLTR